MCFFVNGGEGKTQIDPRIGQTQFGETGLHTVYFLLSCQAFKVFKTW